MKSKRVVITGAGAVTALGHTLDETFANLCAGISGVAEIPEFAEAGFGVYIGARVPGIEELVDRFPDARRYRSRKLAFALKAAEEAIESAGLASFDGMKCGVFFGVETSRIPIEKTYEIFRLSGMEKKRVDYALFGRRCRDIASPLEIQNKFPFFLPRQISVTYGIKGPVLATSNACASSNYAIGEALRQLRSGRIDVAVTGSADEMIDEYILTGFSLLKALSTNNSDPAGASRPFDTRRDGFVLGEGGAVVVLETLEHALNRGARIICELAGYGSSSDGEKITACNREGLWLRLAMERALKDGGMTPEDIGYINAHGTSTRLNDLSESLAIRSLFSSLPRRVMVNSTKSMLGHSVAAAGAIEAAVTVMTVSTGMCHPTLNLESPDTGCDLDYCIKEAVRADFSGAISNSCGFSGGNSCLVFKRFGG